MIVNGRIDRRRLARALSTVEAGGDAAGAILDECVPRETALIGICGPPGAGKSTLVDCLAAAWAGRGMTVAVLSIDPSSPFSGGALLGDRIRMDRSEASERIYHRSIASRGRQGGLSNAAWDILTLLSSVGFDHVLIETVGAGQSDIDVLNVSDCVIVVDVPGLGDGVQAQKAGIMEIADLYVVNKSDRPGASRTLAELNLTVDGGYMGVAGVNRSEAIPGKARRTPDAGVRALMQRHGDPSAEPCWWRPPVLGATASHAEGIDEIMDAVDAFLGWLGDTGRDHTRQQARRTEHVRAAIHKRLVDLADRAIDWTTAVAAADHISPHRLADQLWPSVISRLND